MSADAVESLRVLVTGTTSGLGRALLDHYASSGARVIAVNRRRVPELESERPSVRFECVDVRSTGDVARLLERLAADGELPDVFLLSAGINRVDNDESFELGAYRDVVDTNLYGVLNFVQPLLRLPAGPAPRHVVAVSSMAAYVGNPYGLGYHTSKRALTACFDAWSHMYAGTDLVFQQVMLGPVRTAIYTMGERFPRWMVRVRDAFSTSLAGAARAVARFAQTRKRKLFHPWRAVPLYLGMWLLRAVVPGFFRGRKTLSGAPRRANAATPSAAGAGRAVRTR
jgi:NAD(P)-dependent dehydrogenase (short-subunit alcohol dehydrogenase family)